MVGVSVVGIAMVAFIGLSTLHHNLLEDRKAKLHDVSFSRDKRLIWTIRLRRRPDCQTPKP
jgi:hypothetical protein